MEAFKVADTIRKEITRQANRENSGLALGKSDEPDTIRLIGTLDLYAIAKALVDR